jgi:hypothetical protein
LQPGVPTAASGWCLTDVNGEEVLETRVLTTRSELDLLLSELTELMRRTGPEFPKDLLVQATGARVGFLTERRPESMDVYLMARGVPCPNGILALSQDGPNCIKGWRGN